MSCSWADLKLYYKDRRMTGMEEGWQQEGGPYTPFRSAIHVINRKYFFENDKQLNIIQTLQKIRPQK